MQNVLMKDSGDAVRRADDGGYGKGYTAKIADFTLYAVDTGKVFTNRGAAGDIVATLPTAVKGIWFAFMAPTAHTFTITAAGGAKIDGGGANGSVVVPAGCSIQCVSDGTDWYTKTAVDSVTLGTLPQGTNGQLLIGATSAAPAYQTVSGDVTINVSGVTAIGANKVLSTMLADSVLHVAEVDISAADIVSTSTGKLGHANGYTLVAAPGSGKVIQLVSAVLSFTYATAAYTAGGNLTVNIGAGGAALTGLISAANSLGASADKIAQFVPLSTAAVNLTVNTALSLVASAAFTNPGTAAGTVKVFVAYRTITL